MRIIVQQQDFNVANEYQWLRKQGKSDGAIVTFTGLVRDFNQDCSVQGVFLEYYPGMTEKSLHDICEEAQSRWPVSAISVIHRVGQLGPNEQIVFVGVASKHRDSAFNGAAFIMDHLKTKAPFWKQELTQNGAVWVEAKPTDEKAALRWNTAQS